MIGGMVVEVGAARFTLYPGAKMPKGLEALIAGREPRRNAGQTRAFRAACSLQAMHADLTRGAFDENVAAADTVSTGRRMAATTLEVHHMSTTATPDAPAKTTGRGRKPAKATRPTPEQLKAMTPDERAVLAPKGLGGKALEHFIATGETGAEQSAKAKAAREKATAAAKTANRSAAQKAAGNRPPSVPRDGITAMEAAERVLRKATGPLKVSEIAAKAVKLPAFKPTSKTPEASVAARVHVSAKAGGTFIRISRGVVDLRELNPRGAAKRPAAKN